MCLIIDVNVAHRTLLQRDDIDFRHIYLCLFEGRRPRVSLVYGGKLLAEYSRNAKLIRALAILDQAVRARRISDAAVDAEAKAVGQMGLCESDDEHIIGLARVAAVRLLCTDDGNLQKDFTNKRLLDKPRGKVYAKARHQHLLVRFCG